MSKMTSAQAAQQSNRDARGRYRTSHRQIGSTRHSLEPSEALVWAHLQQVCGPALVSDPEQPLPRHTDPRVAPIDHARQLARHGAPAIAVGHEYDGPRRVDVGAFTSTRELARHISSTTVLDQNCRYAPGDLPDIHDPDNWSCSSNGFELEFEEPGGGGYGPTVVHVVLPWDIGEPQPGLFDEPEPVSPGATGDARRSPAQTEFLDELHQMGGR